MVSKIGVLVGIVLIVLVVTCIGEALQSDITRDGTVNMDDFAILSSEWLQSGNVESPYAVYTGFYDGDGGGSDSQVVTFDPCAVGDSVKMVELWAIDPHDLSSVPVMSITVMRDNDIFTLYSTGYAWQNGAVSLFGGGTFTAYNHPSLPIAYCGNYSGITYFYRVWVLRN